MIYPVDCFAGLYKNFALSLYLWLKLSNIHILAPSKHTYAHKTLNTPSLDYIQYIYFGPASWEPKKNKARKKITSCVDVMRPLVTDTRLTISILLLPNNLLFAFSSSFITPRPSLWSYNPKTVALCRPPNTPFSPTLPSFAEGLEGGHWGQSLATAGDPEEKEMHTARQPQEPGIHTNAHLLALCERMTLLWCTQSK